MYMRHREEKENGCAHQESICPYDGNRILYFALSAAAEPRIRRGTEGEGDDRRGSAFKPRNHVLKPVQNGKRWCDQLREGRGEKKNLCDHPAWKRDFGAGKKKDRAVAPEC